MLADFFASDVAVELFGGGMPQVASLTVFVAGIFVWLFRSAVEG